MHPCTHASLSTASPPTCGRTGACPHQALDMDVAVHWMTVIDEVGHGVCAAGRDDAVGAGDHRERVSRCEWRQTDGGPDRGPMLVQQTRTQLVALAGINMHRMMSGRHMVVTQTGMHELGVAERRVLGCSATRSCAERVTSCRASPEWGYLAGSRVLPGISHHLASRTLLATLQGPHLLTLAPISALHNIRPWPTFAFTLPVAPDARVRSSAAPSTGPRVAE